MSSSIAYISRKAKHTPLPSSSIPLTILGKTESIEPTDMDEAIPSLFPTSSKRLLRFGDNCALPTRRV